MDHSALFNSVKDRDIEQLHKVLGPTLQDFGSYQTKYWDHAEDGILTSLNKIPGVQGYNCLRWAERVVNDSHQNRAFSESDSCYAEYVYKLRADLLGKALERVTDFQPAERSDIWRSINSAVAALFEDVTEVDFPKKEWLLGIQNKVSEEALKYIS